RAILRGWLPGTEGPGASLTTARCGRLLDNSWLSHEQLFTPVMPLRALAARARWRGDSGPLAPARGLYQLQETKTARKLEEIVPKYLPELPVDPYSGQAFQYRISQGEDLDRAVPGGIEKLRVQPGQGILWSTGPDRVDHGGRKHGEV